MLGSIMSAPQGFAGSDAASIALSFATIQPSVIRLSMSNSAGYFPTASVGGDKYLNVNHGNRKASDLKPLRNEAKKLRDLDMDRYWLFCKVFPLSRTILIWLRLKLDNLCYTVCARTEDKATLRSDLSAGRVTEGRHDVVALFLSALPCPTR